MNAFHVIGGLTAVWAVIVAILGIKSEGFPRGAVEKIVGLVSVVLVSGSIAAAILTAESGAEHGAAETHQQEGGAEEEEAHQEEDQEEPAGAD